ncbi:hypothetical protein AB0M05_16590 [Streptomyces violaceusniger]|uniref:hypothetical protein n=1 Tax=Streptomyces violaceusniger TaxID=68280 RepID=UPI003435B144
MSAGSTPGTGHRSRAPPQQALLHTAGQILALDQRDLDEALRSMLRSGPDPDSGKRGRTHLHLFHASLTCRSPITQARRDVVLTERRSPTIA